MQLKLNDWVIAPLVVIAGFCAMLAIWAVFDTFPTLIWIGIVIAAFYGGYESGKGNR